MNELQKRIFSLKEEEAPSSGLERRRETRVMLDRPVYVQPVGRDDEHFEEVRKMKNFSRNGFYFITDRASYQRGTHLYAVPAFGCLNLEYLGEVVRVEELPGGEFGVAVHLLHVVNAVAGYRTTTMAAFQAFALSDSSPIALPQCDSKVLT